MYLHGPTALRVEPERLAPLVRERFGSELRRAGAYSQLALLGAQACLASTGTRGPLAVLCASERGALHETFAMLNDDLRQGEAAMPFGFIATQPHLAGALLAQRGHPVTRVAHVHLAEEAWPRLLSIAQGWLRSQDAPLLAGWVEEARGDEAAHRSDWCLLRTDSAAGAVRCTPHAGPGATRAAQDWMQRVAARGGAAQAMLVLGGEGGAWRFAPV